jgi:hypothetical protein
VVFVAKDHASRRNGYLVSIVPDAYTVGLPSISSWSVGGQGFAWVTHWLLACRREAACARTFLVSAAVDRIGRRSLCYSYLEAVTLYVVISIEELAVGCTTSTYAHPPSRLYKGGLPSWRFAPGCRIASI